MITIGFLADYPARIPTLIQWFRDQWPDYFASKSDAQMARDFRTEASRDRIPTRLLAFEPDGLVGTIVLRQYAIETAPKFQPGLGGLFVVESHRRGGIGTALVRAGMSLAAGKGYEEVYATTVAAAGILESLGWEWVQTLLHQEEQIGLYRCRL